MNDEQEEFMEEVVDEMTERIETTFPKGVKKYGTTLHKDHSAMFLQEMAMQELTDAPTYTIAIRKRLEDAITLLEKSECHFCKKALAILQ